MSPLPTETYLASIGRDSAGFAEAAEAAGAETQVEHCPDWNVADLVYHLYRVQDFWRTIVDRRLQDPKEVGDTGRPEEFVELVGEFRAGTGRLIEALRTAPQSEAVYTWASQKDVAFVTRHQAQEAAVHRWDAEHAAGRPFDIATDIAADAIDEFLDFSTMWRTEGAAPVAGTVHMHPTDAEGEWMLSEGDDGSLQVERAHGKGDAALRATASDLLLILYRRLPPDVGEVFGDRAVLDRFLARTDLD